MWLKNIPKNKHRLLFQPPQQRLVALLHGSKAPLQDEAEAQLFAAIREMRAPKQPWELAGRSILDRMGVGVSTAQAALTLVHNWGRLSDNAKQVVRLSIPEPLSAAIQTLVAGSDKHGRIAAAEVIADAPSVQGVADLATLLADSSPEVRQAATDSLNACIARARQQPELDEAIDHTLATLADRISQLPDRAVLAPALLCLRQPGVELARILADDGHPAHMVWRSQIRQRRGDLPASELIRLLAVDALAPAALDALSDLNETADVVRCASSSHLLLTPARRQRTTKGSMGRRLLPRSPVLTSAAHSAGSDLLRYIELLGGLGAKKTALNFSQCVSENNDALHAAMVLRLARRPRPDPTIADALKDLSFHENPTIARSALGAIVDDASPASGLFIDHQRRSPHAVCRAMAQERQRRQPPTFRTSPTSPASLLALDDPLADALSMRQALAHDRPNAIAFLRSAMASDDPPAAAAAMRLAARVGVASECELELLAAIATRGEKIVATAVTALGHVPGASADQALNACLNHPDARVRANAIEALSRRSHSVAPPASRQSDAARERCNAVRTLVDRVEPKLRRQGLDLLDSMLTDDRPAHRRSALWLTGRLGRTESARQIASIAANDPDAAIRAAAVATARQLLARMRAAPPAAVVAESA